MRFQRYDTIKSKSIISTCILISNYAEDKWIIDTEAFCSFDLKCNGLHCSIRPGFSFAFTIRWSPTLLKISSYLSLTCNSYRDRMAVNAFSSKSCWCCIFSLAKRVIFMSLSKVLHFADDSYLCHWNNQACMKAKPNSVLWTNADNVRFPPDTLKFMKGYICCFRGS